MTYPEKSKRIMKITKYRLIENINYVFTLNVTSKKQGDTRFSIASTYSKLKGRSIPLSYPQTLFEKPVNIQKDLHLQLFQEEEGCLYFQTKDLKNKLFFISILIIELMMILNFLICNTNYLKLISLAR